MTNITPPKNAPRDEPPDKQEKAAALARLYAEPVTKAVGPCPDDSVFAAYIDRTATVAEQIAFWEHLDGCPTCRLDLLRLTATLQRMSDTRLGDTQKNIPRSRKPRPRLLAKGVAACIALAACVLLMLYPHAFKHESEDSMQALTRQLASLPKSRGRAEPWISTAGDEPTEELRILYQGYLHDRQGNVSSNSVDSVNISSSQKSLFTVGRLIYASEVFCRREDPISAKHWSLLQEALGETMATGNNFELLRNTFLSHSSPSCDGLRNIVRQTVRQ